MPHSRDIILGRVDAMKGNATSGIVVDLRAAFVAVDDFLVNGEPDPTQAAEMGAKCHELEEWLVDGGKTTNPVDTIETFTTELDALL